MDGKCLRGIWRPDGSQVFVVSGVRHSDAVVAADALHAQRAHTTYPVVERDPLPAHREEQSATLAAQRRALPWTDAPVLHRTTDHSRDRDRDRATTCCFHLPGRYGDPRSLALHRQ
ncbi:hypothetical protein [Streptomyces sp. NPDC058622]|uniref:hypothetical protein n=1 Tax=Streptomyces sp. NPDC058622 TaxID=3346562 RepID=UPI00364B1D20